MIISFLRTIVLNNNFMMLIDDSKNEVEVIFKKFPEFIIEIPE